MIPTIRSDFFSLANGGWAREDTESEESEVSVNTFYGSIFAPFITRVGIKYVTVH